MGEGSVGLCHPMRVFLTLNAGADIVFGVKDLPRQTAAHGLLAPGAGEAHHPAQRQRVGPAGIDLNGHLVGRAADAPALDLQAWPDVVQGVVQYLDRARARALLNVREGVVDDFLRGALLTVEHDLVDQLLHEHAPVDGIGGYLLLWWRCSPRHLLSSYDFLVPYLERPCLRLLTPSVSSAPRTTLAHTRQVLDLSPTHEHDGVLLQVVPLPGNVGRDLLAVHQTDPGNLAQRRVRLPRRGGRDAHAHAALLGRPLQRRRRRLLRLFLPLVAHKLVGRGHGRASLSIRAKGLTESRATARSPCYPLVTTRNRSELF